jgi:hypothetical protein
MVLSFARAPRAFIDINLLVANYARFDLEVQRLPPLAKVYWPTE